MKQKSEDKVAQLQCGNARCLKISPSFLRAKVIDEAKADAYVYGYELLISSVVSVLLVVLIAVVCGDVRYALSFLIGLSHSESTLADTMQHRTPDAIWHSRTGTYLHFG